MRKNDQQLTEHFWLSEFTRSETARRLGIDNTPSLEVVNHLQNLCQQVLEPLREWAGQPIIISSGYRCPQLNKAVGGSPTSQHMTGEACDITLADQQLLREWFDHLMQGEFDQLILERASKTSTRYWIHVSCCSNARLNRRQVKQITKA